MEARNIKNMESDNFVGFSTFIAYTNKFVSYEDFKANKRVINEAVSVFKAFYSRFDSRILRTKKTPVRFNERKYLIFVHYIIRTQIRAVLQNK